ncbi:hypothetical protein [uncultured Flavobacterium sp.]|uniref:hypothetical protein n=1 Tax=uncultured Flavobacterium sp. TaxID=165435 RepID=UPI0030EB1463
MNELEKSGKMKTILLAISILLISIHTIYFYHSIRPEFETKKIIQQIIRFSLTFALLYFVYVGKKWAKNISIILFSIGLLGAIYAFSSNEELPLILKTPFIVMTLVYSIAIYHFAFSKSFKAFFEYQNNKEIYKQH